MSAFTNRNPYYESLYKQAEEEAKSYPSSKPREDRKYPNPVYTNPIQYFDSKVVNSHIYPNISYIRPYELGFVPTNVGQFIDESIEKQKTYFYGGSFFKQEPVRLWS